MDTLGACGHAESRTCLPTPHFHSSVPPTTSLCDSSSAQFLDFKGLAAIPELRNPGPLERL